MILDPSRCTEPTVSLAGVFCCVNYNNSSNQSMTWFMKFQSSNRWFFPRASLKDGNCFSKIFLFHE